MRGWTGERHLHGNLGKAGSGWELGLDGCGAGRLSTIPPTGKVGHPSSSGQTTHTWLTNCLRLRRCPAPPRCVFYYSGAASRAGLSYSGAILASKSGDWPASQVRCRTSLLLAACKQLGVGCRSSLDCSFVWRLAGITGQCFA